MTGTRYRNRARLVVGHRKRASGRPDQSGLAPENLTTFAHCSVSSTINFWKSAGDPANGAWPRSVSRCLNFGSDKIASSSELSLLTISPGVFFGATRPYHWLASYVGTISLADGRSGSPSERLTVVTANAPSLPVRTYSIAPDNGEK